MDVNQMYASSGYGTEMDNMKVSTRLQAGFGLLTALMLVLAALAFYGLSALDNCLDGIARVNNEETRLANELRASIQDRAIAIRNLGLITDPRDVAEEAERIKKQDQIYADAYQKLTRMFAEEPSTTAKERSLIDQIKQDEAAAMPPLRRAMELALAQNTALATQEILQNARPPQRVWLAHATELAGFEDQLNKDAQKSAAATYSTVRNIVAVIAAIAVLLGIATATLISRSVQTCALPIYSAAVGRRAARRAGNGRTDSARQPHSPRACRARRPDQLDGFAGIDAREADGNRVGHQDLGGIHFRGRGRDRARQSGSLATHRGAGRLAAGNRGQHGRVDFDRAQQHRQRAPGQHTRSRGFLDSRNGRRRRRAGCGNHARHLVELGEGH